MNKYNRTLKKIPLAICSIVFLENVRGLIESNLKNSAAILQMHSSVESSMWVQAVSQVNNYAWLIYLVLIVLIFKKDIKKLIKSFTETN